MEADGAHDSSPENFVTSNLQENLQTILFESSKSHWAEETENLQGVLIRNHCDKFLKFSPSNGHDRN